MAIQHQAISDPYIHEPKGITTALANTLYMANGGGSGTWTKASSTLLQGLAGDGGIANQRVVTDGTNGFKLITNQAYGAMVMNNNTNALALTAAVDATLNTNSDYFPVTGTGAPWIVSSVASGVTFVTDRLVAPATGVYKFEVVANISAFPTATAKVALKYRTNGTSYGTRRFSTKSAGASDSGQIVLSETLILAATDFIQLYAASTATGGLILEDVVASLQLVSAV